jgi:hypothetical protein
MHTYLSVRAGQWMLPCPCSDGSWGWHASFQVGGLQLQLLYDGSPAPSMGLLPARAKASCNLHLHEHALHQQINSMIIRDLAPRSASPGISRVSQ